MNNTRLTKHLQCIPAAEIVSLSRDESVSTLSTTEAVAIAELVGKITSENGGSRNGLDVIGALMMNVTNTIQSFRRLPTSEEVRLCCRLAHIDDEAAVTQVQYLRLFDIFKRLLNIQAAATTRSEATDQLSVRQRELSSEVSVTVSAMCTGTPFLYQGSVLPIEIVTHLAAKFGLDASRWFQTASSTTLLPTSSHVVRALEELMVQGDHEDEALLDPARLRSRSATASFTPNLRSYDSQAHKLGSRPQQQPVSYISVRMMTELFTPVNDKLVHTFRVYFGAYDPNDPQGIFGVNDLVGGHLSLQLSLLAFRNKLGISEKKLRQLVTAATEQHAASLVAPSPTLAASLGGALESRRSIASIDELPPSLSIANIEEPSPSLDRRRTLYQHQPLYDDQPWDAETIFANGYLRFPDFECIVRFINDEQNAMERIKADQRAAADMVIHATEEELMAGAADSERLLIDAQTAMIEKYVREPLLLQQFAGVSGSGPSQNFLGGGPVSQGKAAALDPSSPAALAELPKVTPSGERVSQRVTPAGKVAEKSVLSPRGPAAQQATNQGRFRSNNSGKSENPNTQTIFVSPNTSVQWHAQASAAEGARPRAVQQKAAPVDLPPLQLAPIPQPPPHITLRGLLGRNAQSYLAEESIAVVGGVDLHHSLADLGPKTPMVGGSMRNNAVPEIDLLEEMELDNEASHGGGRGRGGVQRRSIQFSQASDDDGTSGAVRNSVGEAAAVAVTGLPSSSDPSPQEDPHSLPQLSANRLVSSVNATAKDHLTPAAAALLADEQAADKPRWRNVKHIPRYDGQDIAGYTAAPQPKSARSTRQDQLEPAVPSSSIHQTAAAEHGDHKPHSARAPKRPQPPAAALRTLARKDPSVERQRPATSEHQHRRPEATLDPNPTQQQPLPAPAPPSAPLLSSTQRNVSALHPVVPTRTPSSKPMIPPPLPQAMPPPREERRGHHQIGQQRLALGSSSASFPKEIGAEIWNVLGVRAVPDGFPQTQVVMAPAEVLRPRSDYSSLHSAVLSFNRYQMEAIRLR